MWSGSESPYAGRHYQLQRPLNSPQALSRPHPPIVIGGGGQQKTLRLVARYGDACNLFPTPEIAHKLDVLRGYCDEIGRDFNAIERTSMLMFDAAGGEPAIAETLRTLEWLAGFGVQTVYFGVANTYALKPLDTIAEKILPAVADL
jgi:hypothetical protein